MNINLIKTSASLAAIASILAASGAARATDRGDCAAYLQALPHVYVAGSSAVKPLVQKITDALIATEVVIYVSQGSCFGVDDIFNSAALPTGAGLGILGTADTCTVPAATKADVGASDVFATSCAGVDAVPAGIGDFQGPIQVMNVVVPKGAKAAIQSISAEAAYLVFGFDPSSNNPATGKSYADGTPWTVKDDVWIRGPGSGTQSMIGKAAELPPASWALNNYTDAAATPVKHAVAGGSAEIVTRVGGATNLDSTIGILASNELDDARATVRGLAFQAKGQSCGYWPDSSSSASDKLNVRVGKYDIWGPLHMYTKVGANKKPSKIEAADLIAYVRGEKDLPGTTFADDIVAIETKKNLVPVCAMQVSRESEIGELTSVNPTCSCWYDSKRGGDVTACEVCTTAADCTDKTNICSRGYCEAN